MTKKWDDPDNGRSGERQKAGLGRRDSIPETSESSSDQSAGGISRREAEPARGQRSARSKPVLILAAFAGLISIALIVCLLASLIGVFIPNNRVATPEPRTASTASVRSNPQVQSTIPTDQLSVTSLPVRSPRTWQNASTGSIKTGNDGKAQLREPINGQTIEISTLSYTTKKPIASVTIDYASTGNKLIWSATTAAGNYLRAFGVVDLQKPAGYSAGNIQASPAKQAWLPLLVGLVGLWELKEAGLKLYYESMMSEAFLRETDGLVQDTVCAEPQISENAREFGVSLISVAGAKVVKGAALLLPARESVAVAMKPALAGLATVTDL